jgi:hypothetical protein
MDYSGDVALSALFCRRRVPEEMGLRGRASRKWDAVMGIKA